MKFFANSKREWFLIGMAVALLIANAIYYLA